MYKAKVQSTISSDNNVYVLVDPFNQSNSGVSNYTTLAAERISKLGFYPYVIRRRHNEGFIRFTKRVAIEVNNLRSNLSMVEAPESMASTRELDNWIPIHIRLHLSKELGSYLQGRPYDSYSLSLEQKEISRARFVSAPSQSAIEMSSFLLKIPNESFIYPNPCPKRDFKPQHYKYDALFIGRWHSLKGIEYVTELLEINSDLKFATITCDRVRLPKTLIKIKSTTQKHNLNAIRNSKALIMTSLFETAGLVGLEAISQGRPVISWSHLGICEYANTPVVTPIEPWNLNAFTKAIRSSQNPDYSLYSKAIHKINIGFDKAIQSIVNDMHPVYTGKLIQVSYPKTVELLTEVRKKQMVLFKSELIQRKLRKLQREPVQFMRDSKLANLFFKPERKTVSTTSPAKRTNISSTSRSVRKPKSLSHEKRIIGELRFTDHEKSFSFLDKSVVTKGSLASIILCPIVEKDQFLIRLPFFGLPLKDKSFLGFKDRYLYYFQIKAEKDLYDYNKYIEYLDEFKPLHNSPLHEFKNIITKDPENLIPFIFRNSSCDLRLIVVASETYDLEIIGDYSDEVDVLIVHNNNTIDINNTTKHFKRVLRYMDNSELINLIKSTIIENGSKEKNMLLPAYTRDRIDIIDDIDELNSRHNIDGVIYLDNSYGGQRTDNFNDLISNFGKYVNSIFLKEESYYKYKTLCDAGDVQQLLRETLLGGIRYEVL